MYDFRCKKWQKEQELIKNATIIVNLKENLEVPLFTQIHISDFIEEINGNIINDADVLLVGSADFNYFKKRIMPQSI